MDRNGAEFKAWKPLSLAPGEPPDGRARPFLQKEKGGAQRGQRDVYQYEDLPQAFRVQVVHIWATAISGDHYFIQSPRFIDGPVWEVLSQAMARELGLMRLSSEPNPFHQCQHFFVNASVEHALDLIELTFSAIDRELRPLYWNEAFLLSRSKQSPDDAIQELNARFQQHRIGFKYEGGIIMRVDEEFVHAEMVKPALAILASEGFAGASEEFLKAHEHYRREEFASSMQEALKASESTLKTICARKNWHFDPARDTSSRLLEIVFANKLIPDFLQSEIAALKTTLESGLPTARNKLAGHGQGENPRPVPDYFAAYALHLTATNILLLVRAYQAHR